MKIVSGTIDELLRETGNVLMGISGPVSISTPELKTIPSGRGIWKLADLCTGTDTVRTERTVCYCCKGTDYWLAGSEQYPHYVCRRCHPPALGAERKTLNMPVVHRPQEI